VSGGLLCGWFFTSTHRRTQGRELRPELHVLGSSSRAHKATQFIVEWFKWVLRGLWDGGLDATSTNFPFIVDRQDA
jgi:hypothetical protein